MLWRSYGAYYKWARTGVNYVHNSCILRLGNFKARTYSYTLYKLYSPTKLASFDRTETSMIVVTIQRYEYLDIMYLRGTEIYECKLARNMALL